MKVYFVRHGESEGNATNTHQTNTTSLSEIGKDQARLLAKRFKHISIDAIIASDYARTQQTAEILNQEIQKSLELTPLLREFKNPSEIQGKKTNNPLVMEIKKQIFEHKDDPTWHYSDEENFYDFHLRVKRCLQMLEGRTEQHLLVVSHGAIICMIMSEIVFGETWTPSSFELMYRNFHNSNTGITLCQHDHKGWRLKTWNDLAHLG